MSAVRPRLLFVAQLLPWPLTGGGQIKSFHTLRLLSQIFDIRLLTFDRGEKWHDSPLPDLCKLGIQTVPLQRSRVQDVRTLFTTLPTHDSLLIRRDDNPQMRELVKRECDTGNYTVAHFDHLQMAQFEAVPKRARVVLDNHNVEYRIPKRLAETSSNPIMRLLAKREWPRLQAFESWAIKRADLTLTVSDEDATKLRELSPGYADRIVPVPIGVDLEYFAPQTRQPSQTLLSIGTMFWPPNVEAALYFHRDIWSLIKAECSQAKVVWVGAKPTKAVRVLAQADSSVIVTGSVPDVRSYARDCAAFIVPLLSGSGMRVKILNALAMGLPVVSTTIGAEGIAVTHGENILLADTPEEFARACVGLLHSPQLGEQLGQAGRKLVEEQYGWDAVGRKLLGAYETHILAPQRTEIVL